MSLEKYKDYCINSLGTEDFLSVLELKRSWSTEFLSIIEAENPYSISLLPSADETIEFLEQLKGTGIKGIIISSHHLKDITPIRHLADIEAISLDCLFTKAPDFSLLKGLKVFILGNWRNSAKSIFNCDQLQKLSIDKFPHVNLLELHQMEQLRFLSLSSNKLETLAGIEKNREIEEVDFTFCTKLQLLSGLEQCKKIKKVKFRSCKKIYDFSVLEELEGLTHVYIENCGKIKSLAGLTNLRSLEELFFIGDTNVEDGDLSGFIDHPSLKKIHFADRKHYSPAREQFL